LKEKCLKPGVRYELRGKVFEINKVFPDGRVEVLDNFGMTNITSRQEIRDALYKAELMFEGGRVNASVPQPLVDRRREDCNSLATWFKYKMVNAVNAIPLNMRSNAVKVQAVSEETRKFNIENQSNFNVPSPRTVDDWRKTYRDCNNDLASLISKSYLKGGPGKPRLDARLNAIIEEKTNELFLVENGPHVMTVYREIDREVQERNRELKPGEKPIPELSYDTFAYRIRMIDPRTIMSTRGSERKAKIKFDEVKDPYEKPTRPQEVCEIDSTTLPLLIRHRDRAATLTYIPIVDRVNDYLDGFYCGFDPSSFRTASLALLHAITPKTYVSVLYPEIGHTYDSYGMIETLVTDQGKEYIGRDMEQACAEVGVNFQVCPKRSPWYKGGVERHMREIKEWIREEFRGRGALYEKDEDCEGPKYKIEDLVTLEQFLGALHIWIICRHNRDYHTGIKGVPVELLSQGYELFPPALSGSLKELKIALGATAGRTIQGRGISLNSLWYSDSNLTPLRSRFGGHRKFRIKYDPGDLSYIYVLDDEKMEYVKILAVDQEITKGLTMWNLSVIKKVNRKLYLSLNKKNYIDSKEKIENALSRPIDTKTVKTNKRAVRYENKTPNYTEEIRREGEDKDAGNPMLKGSAGLYGNISDMNALTDDNIAHEDIAVLMSGDPAPNTPSGRKSAKKQPPKPVVDKKTDVSGGSGESAAHGDYSGGWVIGHAKKGS
jgi:putative transposase